MPFPEPPPTATTIPTCATQYLYQIGDLHYYATVDCETGATGVGVAGYEIIDLGCEDGQCTDGAEVESVYLRSLLAGETRLKEMTTKQFIRLKDEFVRLALNMAKPSLKPGKGKGHRFGKSRSFQKRFKSESDAFKARGNGPKPTIDDRRKEVADFLTRNDNIAKIYSMRPSIRDLYLELIDMELSSVRIGDLDSTEVTFLTKDTDLDKEMIGNTTQAVIGDLFEQKTMEGTYTAEDAQIRNGVGIPYVKLENPDVFFRLHKVSSDMSTRVDFLGQQIDESDLTSAEINTMATADWIDRHAHMHVINVDVGTAGPDKKPFFVYSADDLSNNALIV